MKTDNLIEKMEYGAQNANKALLSQELRANVSRLDAAKMAEWETWRHDLMQFVRKNPTRIFIKGQTDEKLVCLTFDDGPDPVNTPLVLDILKAYNIRSSFFIRGDMINDLGFLLKRADQEEHLLLNHTWNHCDLKVLSRGEIRKEITLIENKIFELINKKPFFVRPPFGNLGENLIEELYDYKIVLWSIDAFDWFNRERDFIIDYVVSNVRPGDIVLMHVREDQAHTVAALPFIIEGLSRKGYDFIDLGEMLSLKPYK